MSDVDEKSLRIGAIVVIEFVNDSKIDMVSSLAWGATSILLNRWLQRNGFRDLLRNLGRSSRGNLMLEVCFTVPLKTTLELFVSELNQFIENVNSFDKISAVEAFFNQKPISGLNHSAPSDEIIDEDKGIWKQSSKQA